MRYRFRTPPRLAAAAVLTLAGGLLAAASPPAPASTDVCYSVWIYYNNQGRDYVGDEVNCIPAGLDDGVDVGKGVEPDVHPLPPGIPTGAGVMLYLPSP